MSAPRMTWREAIKRTADESANPKACEATLCAGLLGLVVSLVLIFGGLAYWILGA